MSHIKKMYFNLIHILSMEEIFIKSHIIATTICFILVFLSFIGSSEFIFYLPSLMLIIIGMTEMSLIFIYVMKKVIKKK